jgi:tetratricopeptide (TPR) repeat protein
MPEISPELAARIEQLKSSHQDNPARFFMPLASAYREAGELGRAEELLRENLKRHPGYLSAHVLLGRCLADRGALGEARNEFGYVLSIDPQNLIALRTLGEMAAATGDQAEARRWYGELLAVDPMSAEARQALDALDAAPPAPAQAARDEPGGWDPFAHGDVASPDPVASREPAADAPAYGNAHLDDTELMDAPGFGEPMELGEPPRLEPAPELGFGAVDLPAHDDTGWGDISIGDPLDAPAAPASADAFEFGAVDLDDGWSDAPAPAAADTAGWGTFGDEAPAEPVELRSFHEEDAGEDDVEMVTETMAELYYRQGFVDRAADVYRELITRRGEEPALIGRLAELETELRSTQAPELPAAEPVVASSSWLDEVDAAMAGGARGFSEQEPLGLPAFEAEPAAFSDDFAAPQPEERFAETFAAAPADDAFADSFAAGFDGAADAYAPVRDAWTPPVVEPTAPLAGLGAEPAFEPQPAYDAEPFDAQPAFDAEPAFEAQPSFDAEPAFSAEPSFETGTAFETEPEREFAPEPSFDAQPSFVTDSAVDAAPGAEVADAGAETLRAEHRSTDGTESVATYLWSILSWRPGQTPAREVETASEMEPAAAAPLEYHAPEIEPEVPAHTVETAAPPPPESWDDETLGAPEQQPPLDAPWMADAPAAPDAELLHAASDDEPWAIPAASTEELLPDDDAESQVDELPWLAEEPSVDDLAPAGTEDASGTAASEELMPWEMSLDLPAADEPAAAPAPAEPVGGFSFEDFFSDPAPAPAPPAPAAPAPEPVAPPAPAPAADAAGGEDDEDLESFQAWLQSLKR